ncbi:MAG: CRISPR-associated endonuclease Cas3'', partial [Thermoplasmata archaeon]
KDIPVVLAGKGYNQSLNEDEIYSVGWKSIEEHGRDTESIAKDIMSMIGITKKNVIDCVEKASLWHDVGKAHDKWQKAALDYAAGPSPPSYKFAKFPVSSSAPKRFLPGIRHEAAGALLLWQFWEKGLSSPLIIYLVAAHHGKVRTVLRSLSTDSGDDVFGIQDGEVIGKVDGLTSNDIALQTDMKYYGAKGTWISDSEFNLESISWVEMVSDLEKEFGSINLAFLEAIVRAADIRASKGG